MKGKGAKEAQRGRGKETAMRWRKQQPTSGHPGAEVYRHKKKGSHNWKKKFQVMQEEG